MLISRISDVYRRVSADYNRACFSGTVHRVFDLSALERGSLPFTVLSMVHPGDIAAYLLALRSFCRYANPERVVVVCDPRVQEEHRLLIRRQVPHVEYLFADDFRDSRLPSWGCWERLQAMVEVAREHYTVQLDADTVTLAPPDEVIACIRAQAPFTLGEMAGQQRLPLAASPAEAPALPASEERLHVQYLSELMMHRAITRSRQYVRGCAGFFSLPVNRDYFDTMLEFSNEMRRLLGDRWQEWGTEQVTANYLVSQYDTLTILSWPHYGTPRNGDRPPTFGHYIGSMRFAGSTYREAASQALRQMMASSVARGEPTSH